MKTKTIVLNNIAQTFKLIPEGDYVMGSPESEAGRYSSEIQHDVHVNEFWMADTTVTQALWEAVMGDNPSFFKNENNPVETVSWNDVNKFIENANELLKDQGLEVGLPTEEEWEYACRAGTATAFSFGDSITTDQVNYVGNYPPSGEEKIAYRARTVPVKSLPANPWGLYEMHGNVWEWCKDKYAEYKVESPSKTIRDLQNEIIAINAKKYDLINELKALVARAEL